MSRPDAGGAGERGTAGAAPAPGLINVANALTVLRLCLVPLFIVFLQHARDGIVPFVARWLPAPVHSRPAAAKPLPRREQPAPGQILMKVDAVQRRIDAEILGDVDHSYLHAGAPLSGGVLLPWRHHSAIREGI